MLRVVIRCASSTLIIRIRPRLKTSTVLATSGETRIDLTIENAGELGRRFDLIICTGVLHHLADPDAGLNAFRSVLGADGAMYLMVYAPYGRAGVYMLQDYCRKLGIANSLEEINDLATVVQALPFRHRTRREEVK